MGQAWNGLWLTAAFLSELAALAALGWWGFTLDAPGVVRVLAGIGVPLAAAALWGVFAAPRAPVQVLAVSVLVKIVVFGAAVWALVATGHPRLAIALGVVALLSSVLSPSPDAVGLSDPGTPVPPTAPS
jgi:hypothetical protein